jgi:hypothetical protein
MIGMNVPEAVAEELARARVKHEAMNSLHEAYAVILEELDEFWEEAKSWRGTHRAYDAEKARKELVQVAAMAIRAAEDLF